MGKGDEDGFYTLPDGTKVAISNLVVAQHRLLWFQAKMDPNMAGMMGGPFGAGGKESFEKMMKEMSEMEANGEPVDEAKMMEMMGGMGLGMPPGMDDMDPAEMEAMMA